MFVISFILSYLSVSVYGIPGYSNVFLFTLPIALIASAAISFTNYRILAAYADQKAVTLGQPPENPSNSQTS
jgi:hypothetical protein